MIKPIRNAVVILASASPRRANLLGQAGIPFKVAPALGVVEHGQPGEQPAQTALRLAREKAEAGRCMFPDADVVIGADTIVVLDGQVLGKPLDSQDAVRMLTALGGREHEVVTGYAVLAPERAICGTQSTHVRLRPLDSAQIAGYVATGEPLDKAGSYGIQGRGILLVDSIAGDYTNVVGLPLPRIADALQDLGWGVS